ncbi:MAG TPA: nitroreductase family protein [Lentisphaeria bacterium]|nr:MAG: nitroreductase [Lentisphaerae bacterium GWF2_49_21]HBC85777.1 nitroreductase family protein [Lentisphaeria bacterium]
MDALEVLRKRRSIRKYLKKPVSKTVIETIIDCGRLAATARNEQPWEFIAITDAKMRKILADITEYGKFIADSPVCICVFCKDSKYYIEDGSAATENILLAARALGLGTCWVAGDKKPYAEKVGQILGVPAGYRLMSFISVGYSEDLDQKCTKRPLNEVLHWEKF